MVELMCDSGLLVTKWVLMYFRQFFLVLINGIIYYFPFKKIAVSCLYVHTRLLPYHHK